MLATTSAPALLFEVNSSEQSFSKAVSLKCSHTADDGFYSFGWSDMPYQGDYYLDSLDLFVHNNHTASDEAVNQDPVRPSTPPPSPPAHEEGETDEILTARFPSSPTSTARHFLEDFDEATSCKYVDSIKVERRQTKKVGFSNVVAIREYELILGDHPSCRGGMAMQCGWAHGETEFVDLEVHEQVSTKRRMNGLYLNFYKRRERLKQATGMTGFELLRAEYEFCCEQETPLGQMQPTVLRRTRPM